MAILSIKAIYPKSFLPKEEGFKFISVLNDGSEKEDVIVTDAIKGYTCATVNEMKGWRSSKGNS